MVISFWFTDFNLRVQSRKDESGQSNGSWGSKEFPEMSRNVNAACAEACPISEWASGRGEVCIAWGCWWSEDLQSTWSAPWSSGRRSGGRTEPGQASSAPGDTADICTYSPWAPTTRWGEFLAKMRSSPAKSEPSSPSIAREFLWRHKKMLTTSEDRYLVFFAIHYCSVIKCMPHFAQVMPPGPLWLQQNTPKILRTKMFQQLSNLELCGD